MNENIENSINTVPVKGKKNWTLTAVIFVSVLPIVAAYFMYFTGIGVPDHTVNAGTLLPKAVNLNTLISTDEFNRILDKKKWRLIVPITTRCNDSCEANLYITRQVHIRLGEKGIRLERVAANIGGDLGLAELDRLSIEHPELKKFSVDRKNWNDWITAARADINIDTDHYYLLVDQEGNAMMSYSNVQTGNELLKDIKRALKYSIDYQ